MRPILMLIYFFCLHTVWGQNTSELKLDAFTELKVYDGLSVNLIKSSENRAVVKGEDIGKVVVLNTNGVLKIRMQITRIFSGYKTFVDVYYTNELLILDVNEDALITASSLMDQKVLELRAQEGGEIALEANVDQLLVKAVTGGIVKARGSSEVQDVQINTGGIYEGKEFKSKFATVNVNAGSRAEVFASEYLKAAVKAGGEVWVYGKPKKLEEKTIFGGVIKRM